MPVVTSNICSVVALGADDRSVSVWQTKSARPLIVAKEVFERQILDLSWSWDGLTLYAVSSDGTMGVFNFDPEELEGIAPNEAQAQYLQKFGFIHTALPPNYAHAAPAPDAPADTKPTTPPPTPPAAQARQLQPAQPQQSHSQSQSGFGAARPGEHVNVLVAKKGKKDKDKGKKRIHPTFEGSLAGGSVPSAAISPGISSANVPTSSLLGVGTEMNIKLPPIPPMQSSRAPSSKTATAHQFLESTMDVDFEMGGGDMDMDVPINSLDTSGGTSSKGKRRASDLAFGDDAAAKVPKARTLGGDRVRETPGALPEVREIRERIGPSTWMGGGSGAEGRLVLAVPTLKTFLECKVEDTSDVLEARNPEDGGSECSRFLAMLSSCS